jgi:hypothetical protein
MHRKLAATVYSRIIKAPILFQDTIPLNLCTDGIEYRYRMSRISLISYSALYWISNWMSRYRIPVPFYPTKF